MNVIELITVATVAILVWGIIAIILKLVDFGLHMLERRIKIRFISNVADEFVKSEEYQMLMKVVIQELSGNKNSEEDTD